MQLRNFLAVALLSGTAQAVPLQTITTYCTAHQDQCQKGTMSLLAAKGTTDNLEYVVEVDPATGEIPTSGGGGGGGGKITYVYGDSVRNDYTSVPVTTGAWVELVASTPALTNGLLLFDSSGQTLELGTGAMGSETRVMLVTPGGPDAFVPLTIPVGTRVSVRAVSADATVGEIDLTLFN